MKRLRFIPFFYENKKKIQQNTSAFLYIPRSCMFLAGSRGFEWSDETACSKVESDPPAQISKIFYESTKATDFMF